MGEFYLTKLRYNDAATVYRSFTELNPLHRVAPHFSMRVVEIYGEGGFAQLVVEAKKEFAGRYGLEAVYWQHFDIAEADDVRSFLKMNLKDLAGHYHSLYQDESLIEQTGEHYGEALVWYREFLGSFPADAESPGMNYQLADLLFEAGDFHTAATEYEHTAYDYDAHEQSAAAGYAAIYAHRQHLDTVEEAGAGEAKLLTVESSLRFAETFPDHEQAPTVLGAAAEDLYAMHSFERAITAGRWLIGAYPAAESALRLSAWSVVAHSSFELAAFADAEVGYVEVLALTPPEDESRAALFDNLAASIYKQGEEAAALDDFATAADHYLRIKTAAPDSSIRPAAEYDAAAALMELEDWTAAAAVFRDFREVHVDHELQPEVTKQLAFVYRQAGEIVQSAQEYERVADDAEDPELRRESILLAGELYSDAEDSRALTVYQRYVDEFPHPVDLALETHNKIAQIYLDAGDDPLYRDRLQQIVDIDAAAGEERTPRTRYLAATSSLVLAEPLYEHFEALELTLPFEASLEEKQGRMDAALAAFERLVDYEVAEVTAAATFYMAEIYGHFGVALLDSERPTDLDPVETADYELAIEEEAFPFEERAIEVHEKNHELLVAGTWNGWVSRSLGKLAELVPGRYAKAEISSGLIGPVEVYAYRSPGVDVLVEDVNSDVSKAPEDAEPGQDGTRDVTAVF